LIKVWAGNSNFFLREVSVVGRSPRIPAAPCLPLIRQCTRSSTSQMCFRSTRFRSSRTFPGHGYCLSLSMVCLGIEPIDFPIFPLNSWWGRSPISSRNGVEPPPTSIRPDRQPGRDRPPGGEHPRPGITNPGPAAPCPRESRKDPRPFLLPSSGNPGIVDSSSIPFLGGQDIEMEGRQVFQGRIGFFKASVIDRLDVMMAGIAKIDAAGIFSLAAKIVQGPLLLAAADGTGQPIDPPLAVAIGAEGIPHSPVSSQQAERGRRAADRATGLPPRFRIELSAQLFPSRFDRRPRAAPDQER